MCGSNPNYSVLLVNILRLLNTTRRPWKTGEAPPNDRCSFARKYNEYRQKLLLSADEFACDLGNPLLAKPCRWKTHIDQSFGGACVACSQTSTRASVRSRRWWWLLVVCHGWTLPLPQATVFGVRSRYVAGGGQDVRNRDTERERGSEDPMVDPMERSPWSARRPRERPIDGDCMGASNPFSLSLLPHCKVQTIAPEHVRPNVRSRATPG